MYKVLIADDEKIIRMGLRGIIDWEELGYEVLWEASNGADAVKIIKEENPDVVLFDIKMPKMHGLEAIKTIREFGYKGKIIILSGFSEFSYAQEAIKYNISAYLTKPVDEEYLVEILNTIKEEYEKEKDIESSMDVYKEKARRSILTDFVLGSISADEIDAEDLDLKSGHYQVVIYEKYSSNDEDLAYDLSDVLRVTSNAGEVFETLKLNNNNVVLLKGKRPIENLNHLMNKYYEELPPEKNSPLDTIFITCGSVVKNYKEIPKSYKEAHNLMQHRFFCDKSQHFMLIDDYSVDDKVSLVTTREDILEKYTFYLSNQIQAFNRNKIAESLLDLKNTLYNADFTVEEEKKILVDLYLNIKESMTKLSDAYSIPFIANSEAVNFIEKSYYLYEILQFLTEQFDMIMTSIGYSSRDSIIDDVLFYIQHNYSKNITLENIAPLFGYNSSYLGKIFSRKVGVNFNTYLDKVRIEHSKEILINSKTQVYKVAEMVGYRNVDYFHIKFKKHTGKSPAEYRKTNGKQD